PEYAPIVRAALLALSQPAFNLNGVQATTHMAAPLLVVNGPVARAVDMNPGANAFGSGNRANATIGRAIRLVLLNVGGAWPGDLDKATLGHPGNHLRRRRERGREPVGALPCREGVRARGLDRLRHCRRAAAQRHKPRRRRS